MTQPSPTLSEAVDAYQKRGCRLWNGEPLDRADEEMLERLKASGDAAKAFATIMKGAAQTHAKKRKEAEKRKEAAKAFTKRAEQATSKAFARMTGKTRAKALARMKEAAQAHVSRLKHAAAEEGAAIQAFAKRVEEAAAEALTKIAPLDTKAPFLIDDCVEARQIHAGKHQAQVERLRKAPSEEEMWTKLAELAVYIGASNEHDKEAIRMMSVALGDRLRRQKYDLRSTSRRGDETAAHSEAIAWIKSSVRRLSGRTNAKRVMTLCDVVLGDSTSAAGVKEAVTKEELLDRRFKQNC